MALGVEESMRKRLGETGSASLTEPRWGRDQFLTSDTPPPLDPGEAIASLAGPSATDGDDVR